MQIIEITALSESRLTDLLHLMHELSPDKAVGREMILAAVECPATRIFAVVEAVAGCEESRGGNGRGESGGDSRGDSRGDDCEDYFESTRRECGVAAGGNVDEAAGWSVSEAAGCSGGVAASERTGGNSGSSVGGNCGEGRIVGCASLCVFDSPTGRKGHIEDVVVYSDCRGRHLGRKLLEYILDYARTNLAPIDIHLTSRPSRVAANALYRSIGFEQRDTNVYRLIIG